MSQCIAQIQKTYQIIQQFIVQFNLFTNFNWELKQKFAGLAFQ